MVQDINTASQAASQRPQQEAQESVEIPAKCPYFGPSPHQDVWLEGWYAACAAQTAPQQEAQEPAAVVVPCHTPSGKRVALYSAKQDLPIGTQLYTAHQPSPAAQGDALSDDAVRVPLDSLHADAAYLIGRLREGSMPYARVIEIIRERVDAAKAAIHARAAQGDALDAVRYRFLRDGEWRDTDLEPFIRLQLNTLWDAKIDAARAAQEGK